MLVILKNVSCVMNVNNDKNDIANLLNFQC